MKQLFAVMLRHGAVWRTGLSLEDQVDWEPHRAFMNDLEKAGFVVLGGPLEGTDDVLLIVRAETPEEILDRLAPDPWHKRDLLRVNRVTPWNLRMGSLP